MEAKNSLGKAFTNAEVAAFCGQMAIILKSGISALEGLEVMKDEAASKAEAAVLDKLIEDTTSGSNLGDALKSTGLFPDYMTQMVDIGEETGTLSDVFEALEIHYEREAAISKSVRSSLTFPLIMIGMMIVVIVVLLTVVLPIFNQVFQQLGTEMTGISRTFLNIGNALSTYSVTFIAILAVLVILIILGFTTKTGKSIFKKIGSLFPAFRRISTGTAACRFASGMSLTLRSGLNPERCLELVCQLNEDEAFAGKLGEMKSKIDEGCDASKAISESKIFTGVQSRLCTIGDKTGHMEDALDKIADLYQDEVDSSITRALSVLEPTLVVILSIIVGVILLSVMLPLMGIMSGI